MEEDLKKRKKDALNDRSLLAKVSNDLATYYYKHERYSDALCEYELQVDIYAKLGLQIKWAACHRMMAEMYLLMEEFDKAIEFVKHHLSVARELKNLPEELMAIETLGRIYLVQGESFSNNEKSKTSLQAAEKTFKKGLALCETYSKTSQRDLLEIQVRILLESGEVQEHLGFYEKGINFIRKAIIICLNEDFFDVLHKCYTTKAYLHIHQKDYTAALSCFDIALKVASRFNDKALKTCETLTSKADILCKMSDYRGAKQVLLKAWKLKSPDEKERQNIEFNLRLVKKMCDTEGLVVSSDTSDHITFKKLYEKLGDGACRLKNYAGAVEYYLKMLDHAVRAGDCGTTLGPIYFRIYQTYLNMGCYNEALVYCKKEYEVWKKTPNSIFSLNNIAENLFCAKKPYHQVEKACISVRDIAKKIKKKQYEIILLNRLLYYQEKYGETYLMKDTKAELQALAQDNSYNLESSEDEQSSVSVDVMYEDTMHVSEDDVRLEDLSDSPVTEDKEVAEMTKKTNNITITKNSKEETTPLHHACLSGNKHEVQSLLTQGHPVNIRNNAGWVPLHEACLHGRLEIAKMLINSGADVNDIEGSKCRGTTPLHDAASNGHLDVVQLLLKKGAIPSVKNDFNETPLDALQKWRTNKIKLSKEKEIFYEYICNKMNKLIEISSSVDNDTSKSKIRVKPTIDISLPSTSKTNNKIQDVIKNYNRDDEIIELQNNKNQWALTSNDTTDIPEEEVNKSILALIPNEVGNEDDLGRNKQNMSKITLSKPATVVAKEPPLYNTVENITKDIVPVVKTNKSKKQTKSRIRPNVAVNEKSSNYHNFQNYTKDNSEVISAESVLNISREFNNSLIETTGGVDFDILKSKTPLITRKDISLFSTLKKSSDIQNFLPSDDSFDSGEFPVVEVKNSKLGLLAPNAVKDGLDVNKNNNIERKSSPVTVIVNKAPLVNDKNNIENIRKTIEPLVETKKRTKQKKSRISHVVNVNKNNSNSGNFQDTENVCSESMLHTSRELNDSSMEYTGNVDLDILEPPIKDISLPSSSGISNYIQESQSNKTQTAFPPQDPQLFKIETAGEKACETVLSASKNKNASKFPEDNINKSVPALLTTPSDVGNDKLDDDLGINKHNNMKKRDKEMKGKFCHPSNVSANILLLDNHNNSLENKNEKTEPLVESKKIKKSRATDDVDVKSSSNSDNFHDNHDMFSKAISAESMVKTTRENTDSVHLNRSKSAVNPILNITLPSFSEISDYIQELQNSRIQTAIPPEDPHSSNNQEVFYETEISSNKAYRSAKSASLNTNASVFRDENDINKSILSLFSPNGVGNDKINKNLSRNIQKKIEKKVMKTEKKTDKKNNNRKLSDPFNNVTTENLSDNHRDSIKYTNTLIEPLLQSKKSTQTKSRVSDFEGVREHNTDAGNENLYPKIIAVKSLANKENNSVDNMNFDINQPVNVIQPVNIAQTSNMQTQIISSTTVTVYIEDELQLISLDLDKINMLTISWLVEEVKCRYYKLKGSCPVFNLMTSEGAILFEDEPLNLVLSSPVLYTCLANFKASPDEGRHQESHDELGILETEEDDKLFPLHESPRPTAPRPEPNESRQPTAPHLESPQLISNIQNNRKRKLSDPSYVVANKFALYHKNELIESLVESKKSVSENIIDAEYEKDRELKDSKYKESKGSNLKAEFLIKRDDDVSTNCGSVTKFTKDNWRQTPTEIFSRPLLSENRCNTNDGFTVVDNMNVIQPINIAQTSNKQTHVIPPATVTVHIEDELQFISLDLDSINMLTISWLVEEVKSRYYKLKGLCPVFNLMTSEGAILFEDEPLNLVLSSPELYTCLANFKASPAEKGYLENNGAVEIHDAITRDTTDDVKLLLLHDRSTQLTSPRAKPYKSPQPTSSHPKHDKSLQPVLYAKSPRPGSLAQPTSSGCGFSGPALPSKSMPGPSSPTDQQGPMIPLQSVFLDELKLDGDSRQLLGVACSTETHLGPPVHKAVAKSCQEILAKGLQKEVTDQIMESYSVPANCDLLMAPTLNPEVKATVRENTASLDSSLMEQQKQLGLAISALCTAVNSILLNETSKQTILKPISDACHLLCDIHFRGTETRRHNVITSTAPELQDSLANTVRSNQLFGDNVTEKIKSEKYIQQSGETLRNVLKPAFDLSNQPSTSEGNLNFKPEHEEADNKRT